MDDIHRAQTHSADFPRAVVTRRVPQPVLDQVDAVATRTRMARLAAGNLIAGLRGECLPHCVKPGFYG